MADKEKNVVLNFKMDGQVQYAETLREINAVMNTAAKEYKNHIAAMGKDADMTDKLAAEKKKLEIQMEAAQKRTKMLSDQYEAMSKDTKTTTGQLTQMYGKLLDAEKAETALQKSLDRVNGELSEQGTSVRDAKDELGKLSDEMSMLESEQRKLSSSFELQNASLSENASEAEKVELSQKQMRSQMQLTERVISNLENQLDQAKKAYGENSKEVMDLETKLNGAQTSIQKFNRQLEKVDDSSRDAKKGLEGVSGAMQVIAGAVPIAAVAGLAEGTRELSTDLARLKTNVEIAGRDMDVVNEAFKQTASISGEADSAVETLSNILASGFKDEQLSEVIDNINGAAIKFSDTLKTEGIADGIQETFATGAAIGQFGELLERSGVDLEKFDKKLAGAKNEGDRANVILQQMSSLGLTDVLDKYKELNPEIAEANQAQVDQEIALAELGDTLRPLVTEVAQFTTNLIEWANENPRLTQGLTITALAIGALVAIAAVLAPIITAIGVSSGGAAIGVGSLMTSLLPIIGVIAGVSAAIAGLVLVIQNWGSITDWLGEKWEQFSTWIQKILGSIVEFFTSKLDWIDEITNGKFKSITDAIRNYLEMGLDNVKVVLQFIEDTFQNGLNFIKSLVTLDFEGMWQAIKDQMGNIKDTVSEIWGNVMDFFKGIDLWEIGKDIIGGFIKGFKSLKIPTPHFSITGELDLNPVGGISLPKIDIDWRAKGGIFTQPTIFGASGGRLQGAGEAGPEAVLPLNAQTLGDIGRGIAAEMSGTNEVVVHVYLDTDQIGESVNNYNAVDALTKVL